MKVETFNKLFKKAEEVDCVMQELAELTIPADIRLTGMMTCMIAIMNEYKYQLESVVLEDET